MTSAVELSDRLLRADSATRELENWCQQYGIGDGRITALRQADAAYEQLDDHSIQELNDAGAAQDATFRRVRLVTAGITVVEALNWYFPKNLTAEMCEQLLKTDEPFGRVIARLRPRRRTFLVNHSPRPKRCEPFRDPNPADFEHRAIVLAGDSSPLAVVHERFLTTLLRPAADGGWRRRKSNNR